MTYMESRHGWVCSSSPAHAHVTQVVGRRRSYASTDHVAGARWECLGALALAEEHIAAPHRAQITRWLRWQTPYWPATFVAVCDSVFGPPTLSGAYVLRACIASHIAAFLALCLSGVFYPGTSGLILWCSSSTRLPSWGAWRW